MRISSRLALVAALLTLVVAGAAPAVDPLVKPVNPASGAVRVRFPVKEDKETYMRFQGQIPKPKGKKGETIAVTALIETSTGTSQVSLKKWQSWGFEVPANRTGVIPELIIPAAQLSPKASKGGNVEVRIPAIQVEIIEPPGGADTIGGCDLSLHLRDLTKGADRAVEPRVYFGDRFIELTVAGQSLNRLNTGDGANPDPAISSDTTLIPVMGPMTNPTQGTPTFVFGSVNGITLYKTPEGRLETVNVGVSSTTNYPAPGIVMTLNTARGCEVEMEPLKAGESYTKGKVKEFRLALLTGPGFKAQKDFVLKDVTVYITDDKTTAWVWLGPRFLEEYFTDAVYGCAPDGWRLHGRVKPELLLDVKTRTPAKKP